MHRYVELPFMPRRFTGNSRESVIVGNGKITTEIGLIGGTTRVRGDERGLPPFELRDHGSAVTEETPRGPQTRLGGSPESPPLLGAVVASKEVVGLAITALRTVNDTTYCVATMKTRDGPTTLRLLARGDPAIFVSDEYAACLGSKTAHIFRRRDDKLESVTVSLPKRASSVRDVAVVGSSVRLLVDNCVVIIDASALPFGRPHANARISLEPLESVAIREEAMARVVYRSAAKMLVDHPRLGRVSVDVDASSPIVAKGDSIYFDDFREAMPGVYQVLAWRRADGTKSSRPPRPTFELPAPRVAPLTDEELHAQDHAAAARKRTRHAAHLVELATAHAFRAPETLVRFLREHDEDPAFRRWCKLVGLGSIDLGPLRSERDSDPNLLGVFDRFPEIVCLYIYPPWCSAGYEPVIVNYSSELNSAPFEAMTAEQYIRGLLGAAESVPECRAPAGAIRARLGLTDAAEPDVVEAPTWLPSPHRDAAAPAAAEPGGWFGRLFGAKRATESTDPVVRAREAERRYDYVAAERLYLAAYLHADHADLPARRFDLVRAYLELGWTLPIVSFDTRNVRSGAR